jgi:DNA (cytosine-5)-methyltransferase 1
MKPRLLDLFSGAGGAGMGYHRAGFAVFGVDIEPQKHYPFAFHLGDALVVVRRLLLGEAIPFTHKDGSIEWLSLSDFAAVHGSPPCQLYSVANNIHQNLDHPDLLPPTREAFKALDIPWVIENVPGAPMDDYVTLCGRAFGLGVKRHRQFEASFFIFGIPECPPGHPGDWVLVFGHTVLSRAHVSGHAKGGGPVLKRKHLGIARGREAMGIDWMNRDELSQAIPPAYSEFIGLQLLGALRGVEHRFGGSSPERILGTFASPGRRTGSLPNTGGLVDSASSGHLIPAGSVGTAANSHRSGRGQDAQD